MKSKHTHKHTHTLKGAMARALEKEETIPKIPSTGLNLFNWCWHQSPPLRVRKHYG